MLCFLFEEEQKSISIFFFDPIFFLSPSFSLINNVDNQRQSAIRAAMRTDDSFYQENYINANVNGVRPYWKNVKVSFFECLF